MSWNLESITDARAQELLAQLLRRQLLPVTTGLGEEDIGYQSTEIAPGNVFSRVFPTANTSTAIAAAVSSIGSAKGTVHLNPGVWTISSAVTVPANVHLSVEAGAVLTKSGSGSLAVNGSFSAPMSQVFSSDLVVTFGAGFVEAIYPQWWGALGDNSHDDTAALQRAIDAAWASKSSVALVGGIYNFTHLTLPGGDDNGSKVFRIYGASGGRGSYGSRLNCTATDGLDAIKLVTVSAGASSGHTYTFEHLMLIGPDRSYPGTCGNGLVISGAAVPGVAPVLAVPTVIINDVTILWFTGTGKAGLWLDGPEHSSIAHLKTGNCAIGTKLTQEVNSCTFTNLQVESCYEVGFHATHCGPDSVIGGFIQANYKTGMYLERCSGWTIQAVDFEQNNRNKDTAEWGLQIRNATGGVHDTNCTSIISCIFVGYGGTTIQDGIYVNGVSTGVIRGVVIIAANLQSAGIPNVKFGEYTEGCILLGQMGPAGTGKFSQWGLDYGTGNTILDYGEQAIRTIRSGTLAVTGNVLGGLAIAASPGVATLVLSATTGSLAAGTYHYKVTAINDHGETLGTSPAAPIVLADTGGVRVYWLAVEGAKAYKVYGRASGSEEYMATVNANQTTEWTDDGTVTPSGALPTRDSSGDLLLAGRRVYYVAAGPSSGGAAGDRAILHPPVAGAAFEWVCTTPGTWKALSTLAS